jgi:hypothetical protein
MIVAEPARLARARSATGYDDGRNRVRAGYAHLRRTGRPGQSWALPEVIRDRTNAIRMMAPFSAPIH